MVRRLEDIKAAKCSQCGTWFYYKRKTAKFCSPACRKRSQRGIEPTDDNRYGLTDLESLAAIISERSPLAFRKLEYIRDHYGNKALNRTLEIIELIGGINE